MTAPHHGPSRAFQCRRAVAVRLTTALVCLLASATLAGCFGGAGSKAPRRGDRAPVIAIGDLVDRDAAARRHAVDVSPSADEAPDALAAPAAGSDPADARDTEAADPRVGASGGPDGVNGVGDRVDTRPVPDAGTTSGRPAVGREARPTTAQRADWIVDGLVGQINGRPIFAETFLEVLEDRIIQIVATRPRATARDEIIMLVDSRFEDWVNSELIVAEAESQLSPEQKQGVLAWMRDLQEGEILRRGGTRSAAESSLQEERGMGIEEFLELRRNRALALDLLRRRVAPRAIVSWRDIEREFARREAEFNPGARIVVGRIWLLSDDSAESIEFVTRRFSENAGFREVAEELELPEGGAWREFALGPEGIAGLELAEELRDRLVGLPVDRPTEAFQLGRRTVWLGILELEEARTRTLFDPEVQLILRNELQARREAVERDRYIASLRQRWIAEDIDEMRFRLIDIALRRYWR